MKFTYKAILLILLLCLSHAVDAKEKIKRSSNNKKRLSNKKSKSHSGRTTGILQDIKAKLVESAKDPMNILNFILGATSAWVSEAELFYKFIKDHPIQKLRDLYENCSSTWTRLFRQSEEKPVTPPVFTMSSNWDTLTSAQKKTECQNMKKTFKTYYFTKPTSADIFSICTERICEALSNPFGSILNNISSSVDIFAGDYCAIQFPGTKAKVIEKWKKWEAYDQECQFFKSMDCEDPEGTKTPSYSAVVSFMKMSYNFYTFVDGGIECFNGLKDVVSAIALVFPGITAIFRSYASKVMGFIAGAAAQVFTVGVWGILRGTYLLLKMGYGLYKLVHDSLEDLVFSIGQTVGLGIRAAITFVTGKKKLKLRKMK